MVQHTAPIAYIYYQLIMRVLYIARSYNATPEDNVYLQTVRLTEQACLGLLAPVCACALHCSSLVLPV